MTAPSRAISVCSAARSRSVRLTDDVQPPALRRRPRPPLGANPLGDQSDLAVIPGGAAAPAEHAIRAALLAMALASLFPELELLLEPRLAASLVLEARDVDVALLAARKAIAAEFAESGALATVLGDVAPRSGRRRNEPNQRRRCEEPGELSSSAVSNQKLKPIPRPTPLPTAG